MKIFNGLFSSKRPTKDEVPQPKPSTNEGSVQPKVAKWNESVDFSVRDDKLIPSEPKDLEDYYQSRYPTEKAEKAMSWMKEASALQKRDGAPDDLDDRDGHIVLAEQRFESHGPGSFQQSVDKTFGGKTAITGQDGTLHVENKNLSATWDLHDKTFTLKMDRDRDPIMPGDLRDQEHRVVRSETLPLDEKGRVMRPNARSLEEADATAFQRRVTARAQDLLDSAHNWMEFGQSLDQADLDKNSTPGKVVSGNIPERDLPAGFNDDDFLVGTTNDPGGLSDMDRNEHFGIQLVPGGFLAVAHGGRPFRDSPSIKVENEDGLRKLSFRQNYWGGDTEELIIDSQNGTVTYNDVRTPHGAEHGPDPLRSY